VYGLVDYCTSRLSCTDLGNRVIFERVHLRWAYVIGMILYDFLDKVEYDKLVIVEVLFECR
jgi:hypothetical protein